MKHEWRKHEKELYGVKTTPVMISVPQQQFIMICGKGNPNDSDFSDKVGALYALAYAIKMGYKSNPLSSDITDYSVYPLEGIWKQIEGLELVKDNLEYTIMIRQPDFINKEIVDDALEKIKIKKPNPLYEQIIFDTINEEKSVQILHIGAFDDEPASFKKMDDFLNEHKLERIESYHREIYLNNANRTAKNKLKTILRYTIK